MPLWKVEHSTPGGKTKDISLREKLNFESLALSTSVPGPHRGFRYLYVGPFLPSGTSWVNVEKGLVHTHTHSHSDTPLLGAGVPWRRGCAGKGRPRLAVRWGLSPAGSEDPEEIWKSYSRRRANHIRPGEGKPSSPGTGQGEHGFHGRQPCLSGLRGPAGTVWCGLDREAGSVGGGGLEIRPMPACGFQTVPDRPASLRWGH